MREKTGQVFMKAMENIYELISRASLLRMEKEHFHAASRKETTFLDHSINLSRRILQVHRLNLNKK
jgi:hypothetical protein